MQKKKGSQILFTNDPYVEASTQRGNRTRTNRIPTTSTKKIRTFDFVYSFNDYLKLTLAKILPKYDKITFIADKNTIIGEEHVCQELITKTQKEFTSHKFIMLYKKKPSDIDELDFWLDEEVNIYRPEVIELGLRQLEKMKLDVFRDNIEGVRDSLSKGMFLMRLAKIKEAEIRQKMEIIVKDENEPSVGETGVQTAADEEEVTYYEEDKSQLENPRTYLTPERRRKEPIVPPPEDSCSIDLNSIIESSVEISETDHQDVSCIYTTSKKKKGQYREIEFQASFERFLPTDIN